MTQEEFKLRTKQFALCIMRLMESLPKTRTAFQVGGQLLRAGTSVGANYRAACRGQSTAEFCSKLGIVEEEADESVYWLELIAEAKLVRPELLYDLTREANEILSTIVASIRTARQHK
jgi:four helix bundle protein